MNPQNTLENQTVSAQSNFTIVLTPDDARGVWEQIAPALAQGQPDENAPDSLILQLSSEGVSVDLSGVLIPLPSQLGFHTTFKTTFFPTKNGILLSIAGEEMLLEINARTHPNANKEFERMRRRNQLAGFKAPAQKSNHKPIPTDESLAMLPNTKADQDLYRGLMHYPHNWALNGNLVNRYHDGKHGHTIIYQPSEVERALGDAPARALDALDRRFNQLRSETVADVIDILFHHWNTHKDSQTSAVAINAARLCEYRGIEPEGDNLRLHWEALRDAFSLTLRDTNSDINAKVFNADSQGETKDGPGARYAYRPGIFLEYALRGEQLYFAPFLQKVWALDPKKNNEAKRLARYLRADWRMNPEKYLESQTGQARAARWHSWAFLLAESGIDVESHRTNANGPKRLIEKMKRAVETLYQMEVVAEGGFDIYHPDDRKRAEDLPTRGALDTWLALRVCLAPSAKLREALLETDAKRRAQRARDATALANEGAKKRLRAERKTKPKK